MPSAALQYIVCPHQHAHSMRHWVDGVPGEHGVPKRGRGLGQPGPCGKHDQPAGGHAAMPFAPLPHTHAPSGY